MSVPPIPTSSSHPENKPAAADAPPAAASQPSAFSGKYLALLVILTLCWGVNWPVMKLGVMDFPPITFRALCMLGGLPALWLLARQQKASLAIPPGRLGELVRLAIPNVVMWHALIIIGVSMLPSGRAAILGYTMPIWALLTGLVFYGEKPPRIAWIGVGCAMAGALLLLSNELASFAGQPLGTLMALLAAAGWGYGTVALKRSRLGMPTISLTFWMMAIAVPIVCTGAFLMERSAWRWPGGVTLAAIVYNAVIVLALCQVIWFTLARLLTPLASSLSVMMIPVTGVFSGMVLLGERPHWQDYAAMVLILAAMATVLPRPSRSR